MVVGGRVGRVVVLVGGAVTVTVVVDGAAVGRRATLRVTLVPASTTELGAGDWSRTVPSRALASSTGCSSDVRPAFCRVSWATE